MNLFSGILKRLVLTFIQHSTSWQLALFKSISPFFFWWISSYPFAFYFEALLCLNNWQRNQFCPNSRKNIHKHMILWHTDASNDNIELPIVLSKFSQLIRVFSEDKAPKITTQNTNINNIDQIINKPLSSASKKKHQTKFELYRHANDSRKRFVISQRPNG